MGWLKKFLVIIAAILMQGMPIPASAFAQEVIAYTRYTDGYWQIWTMAPDGSQQQQVTSSSVDKRSLVWINAGRQLAFRTNNGRLFLINRDGSDEHEILEQYTNISDLDFSEQSGQIIFTRFQPASVDVSDIWRSSLNGKDAVILTKDRVLKYQPKFSPDGKQIAFVKADKTSLTHQLWLMDTDGGSPRQITHIPEGFDTLPDFSPDGKSVVFTSNRDREGYDIYLFNIAPKKITRLTRDSGLDTHAVFSPDGTKIVFVSNRGGNQQIWVMGRDGSSIVQLTDGADESLNPVWAEWTQ
jgi:Tol biopolymer transport system component